MMAAVHQSMSQPQERPQIRIAKRKLMVTKEKESGGQSFKKVKCNYKIVSKDIEDVEYYQEEEEDEPESYDDIYQDIQLYEENYGFPRQINGQLFYIDMSNFVFDFDTKELIGKLNDSQDDIILFRHDPPAATTIVIGNGAYESSGGGGGGDAMDMDLSPDCMDMKQFVKII